MQPSSLRRFATPLALLLGLVLMTSSAWAARTAPGTPKSAANQARSDAMKAKWQDPAYRANVAKAKFGGNSPQAKKARAEGQWADPMKAAEMVIARHGAAAPSLNKYYEAVKAKYGGNSTQARQLRAKMQWAKAGGREAIMNGRVNARAARVAAAEEAAAAEAPGEDFGGSPAVEEDVPSFTPPASPSVRSPSASVAAPSLAAPPSTGPSRGRGARFLSSVGLGRFVVSRDVRGAVGRLEAQGRTDINGALERIDSMDRTGFTKGENNALDALRGKLQQDQANRDQFRPGN